jgi:hypothetical protein
MRIKLLGVGLLLLLLTSGGRAQAATTLKLAWNQPGVASVAEAQALSYQLQIDAAPALPVVQTCTLANFVVSCTAPLATLPAGAHTLTLTGSNGFGTASASITGTAPNPATNVKIVLTITVP